MDLPTWTSASRGLKIAVYVHPAAPQWLILDGANPASFDWLLKRCGAQPNWKPMPSETTWTPGTWPPPWCLPLPDRHFKVATELARQLRAEILGYDTPEREGSGDGAYPRIITYAGPLPGSSTPHRTIDEWDAICTRQRLSHWPRETDRDLTSAVPHVKRRALKAMTASGWHRRRTIVLQVVCWIGALAAVMYFVRG